MFHVDCAILSVYGDTFSIIGVVTFLTTFPISFVPCFISACHSVLPSAVNQRFVIACAFSAKRGFAFANSPYASIQGFTQGIEVIAPPIALSVGVTQGICVIVSPITHPPRATISPALRRVASQKPIFQVEKSL